MSLDDGSMEMPRGEPTKIMKPRRFSGPKSGPRSQLNQSTDEPICKPQRSNSQAKRRARSTSSTSTYSVIGNCQEKSSPQIKGFLYTCAGCNKPIKRDKYLLKACDKYWHENCLRCDKCHSRLGELGSTLYCKLNMNLCRQDYLEMFGETGVCSVCEKLICSSEMVMRAKDNVYHLECFACQLCNQRFCVGDRFYLCENRVVCQYDYEEHIVPIQQSLMNQDGPSLYHHSMIDTLELPTNDEDTLVCETHNKIEAIDEQYKHLDSSESKTLNSDPEQLVDEANLRPIGGCLEIGSSVDKSVEPQEHQESQVDE